ncbi:MAG TPA: Mut7-C RNAse domain-containing protein [Candidatus Binatia bacterium]|nr:Mut7-C RNAse domain-containing protein [Candidatus Binatia bacterium]
MSATILTTDSMLMERRLLRDQIIPSMWLPPTLTIPKQLALVFREFGLTLRRHRCMACGGELRPVDKEQMRERIPPRTYRWLDEYFVCSRCDKLFWHGTHWERIRQRLSGAVGKGAGSGKSET